MRNFLSVVVLSVLSLLLLSGSALPSEKANAAFCELRKKVEERRRDKTAEAEDEFRRHASSFKDGGYVEVIEAIVASTRPDARASLFALLNGKTPDNKAKVFLYLIGSDGETYRIRLWTADKEKGRAILIAEEERP